MKTSFPHSGPRLRTGQPSSQVMLAHRTRGVTLACRVVCLFVTLACAPPDRGASNAASATQEAQDSVATAVISPDGGRVELKGFATVILPPGAFGSPQAVSVMATIAPVTQQRYDMDVPPRGPPLPYHIIVSTGKVAPATGFEVILDVPDSFLASLPPDHIVRVFAQIVGGGAEEALDEFDPLASDFDPGTKVVRAHVPRRAVQLPTGPPLSILAS